MSDNIVVGINTIQLVTDYTTNTISYENKIIEPVISAGAQGPQGPQGIPGATMLSQLTDVSTSNLNNGSILVYDSNYQIWIATKNLTEQLLEAGQY